MFLIRYKIIFFLFFLSYAASAALKIYSVKKDIQWDSITLNAPLSAVNFENAYYSDGTSSIPRYFQKIKLNTSGAIQVELKNIQYEILGELKVPVGNNFSENVNIEAVIAWEKKQPFAIIDFVPIRINNLTGNYEKVVGFDINIIVDEVTSSSNKSYKNTSAQNSVLSSGNWYKIGVASNGIYKIDYNFLSSLGINPGSIDPRNIRIYGNGGGMLPEANAAFRYDDLQENAIQVVGESDGKFDQGDYILFYGQSPHRWHLDTNTQRFYHKVHLYSDYTYYFITADLGSGLRMGTQPSSTNTPTHNVSSFDDYDYHEAETNSLIHTGREWYGEKFDGFNPIKSVTLKSFPNLLTSFPVYYKIAAAARSLPVSSSTSYSVKYNGAVVSTINIGGVGEDYTDQYANETIVYDSLNASGSSITFDLTYNQAKSIDIGWLNYIEVNVRRTLAMSGSQMEFRDVKSVGSGNISTFSVSNATGSLQVWDITNPIRPISQLTSLVGNTLSFVLNTDSLKEFIAFNGNSYNTPVKIGQIANQNLHGFGQPDLIVVTHSSLLSQAQQLASFHINNDGLNAVTVTVDQIYNEFSSGAQDVSAIRDFVKMFYDRAGADSSLLPKYLLLFGDGSYDYKDRVADNTNYVPTFQSSNSLHPVASFVSDDFFGLLDSSEGSNINGSGQLLDMGIGRLPVKTTAEASGMVNKIIDYASASLGSWRNNITFVADDEDNNLHVNQVDGGGGYSGLVPYVQTNYPVFNISKIYLDAYQQVSTPGGSRYPDVNNAIMSRLFAGSMIMNYTGHGGEAGWAHERIFNFEEINKLENKDKLPLFITATCSFSRYDEPDKTSAGEVLIIEPDGGAIALMTTVRIVNAGGNYTLNLNFLQRAFDLINGNIPTFGDVAQRAKNLTGSGTNNRNFTLLGDPALKMPYSKHDVKITEVNNKPLSVTIDTIKALSKVTISGVVQDKMGNMQSGFNGVIYPTIYDKGFTASTLANDPGSSVKNFKVQNNIIYKGKASVTNGAFSFTFIAPKDIAQFYGYGRISTYADNMSETAAGIMDTIVIGGTALDSAADQQGPEINIFLNDEKFASGGVTDENPVLIVKLKDISGINTVGAGIGHDITAVMDEETKHTIVLNEFYEAALDDYQQGEVRYPLSEIAEGPHTLKVKAWDVYNNSSEGYLDFVVASSEELAISHVLNYPNPFTTRTLFQFEHNRPGDLLNVNIQIYTVSGKLIKIISTERLSSGFRIDDIEWNGLDEFGDKIGRGVYIYRIKVGTPDGSIAEQFEKLVILQ